MAQNTPTREGLLKALQEEARLRSRTMDTARVEEILRYGSFVGSVIESHERLDRAMDRSRQLISEVEMRGESLASGTVVLADAMNRSKGRFTRSWHAPQGGVWGCLIHANTFLDHTRMLVPLAVGLSCCEAVRASGGSEATLRWVNDVLFGEEKVAGFLIEGFSGPRYREMYNLIGFGINVNNTVFPAELAGTAVSLSEVLDHEVDLTEFTTLFLAKLAWNFGLLHYEEARELQDEGRSGKGGRHLLLDNWLEHSSTVGRRVVYGFDVMTRPQYEAVVCGLDEVGGLVMRLDDGSVITEHSGEIRYLRHLTS